MAALLAMWRLCLVTAQFLLDLPPADRFTENHYCNNENKFHIAVMVIVLYY